MTVSISRESIEGIPVIIRFKTHFGLLNQGLFYINPCIEGIPIRTRFKTILLDKLPSQKTWY